MINILIIGVFEGLFLSALLFTKKKRTISDTILASFFLLYGLNILLSYFEAYNRQNGFPYPFFIFTSVPLILLHGPALWFYIKSQTEQHFKFKLIYLLHFLPFLIILLDCTLRFYILSDQERIQITINESFKDTFSYPFVVISIAISTLTYFTWGLFLLNDYNKKIKNYFSQIESIDLHWLKVLLISALTIYSIINTLHILDLFTRYAPFGLIQFITFIIGSLYILFLGFFGHQQENIFTTRSIKVDLDKTTFSAPKPNLLEDADERFIYSLLSYMKEQKPYLNPEITISKLGEELNVTEEYISSILNSRLNNNFFDFINGYRVEEFKLQCIEPKNNNLTLIGIAFNSGFNSKATFNRVFKKTTGFTPSDYKQSVSEK